MCYFIQLLICTKYRIKLTCPILFYFNLFTKHNPFFIKFYPFISYNSLKNYDGIIFLCGFLYLILIIHIELLVTYLLVITG